MSSGIIASALSSPGTVTSVVRSTSNDYTYTMSNLPLNAVVFNQVTALSPAVGYSNSTGLFTVVTPGIYAISGQIQIDPTGSFVAFNSMITNNGIVQVVGLGANQFVQFPGSPPFYSSPFSCFTPLVAGDVLAVYLIGNYSGTSGPPSTVRIRGFTSATFVMISYLRSQ